METKDDKEELQLRNKLKKILTKLKTFERNMYLTFYTNPPFL